MDWLSRNWGWIVLVGAFLALQFFGRRAHGGAGGCCGGGHGGGRLDERATLPPECAVERSTGHPHR
jgi:hypothetical protein